jgi:HAD superfamily hydrolase (TIGR01458 family)
VKAILFDLAGVFYEGATPVKGAADVLKWVRENNIPYLFFTNTTSRNRLDLVAKLYEMGIIADIDHILTPAVAAAAWLQAHKKSNIALFVPDAIHPEFLKFTNAKKSVNEPIDGLVIGDMGKQWTFDKLNKAFRLLMHEPHPAFIALGMTRYWQAEDGLRLDAAPFVMALQHASQVQAIVLGKPSADYYRTALRMLKTTPADTVIIGDDLYTDIEGGQRLGMRGILVRTGKFQQRDMKADVRPDTVLDSVADLPDWWQKNNRS